MNDSSKNNGQIGRHHIARVGVLGQVGRFTSVDAIAYRRGMRVVCRTSRGLEVGEVLAADSGDDSARQSDGSILRGVTLQDELLIARLEKNRREAFAACQSEIDRLGYQATLLEVEQLFDGRAIYFYFLGEVPSELSAWTQQLAETYDAAAGINRFAETLEHGCGPGCGTEEKAGGCGDSCASCSIATACKTK